MTDTPSAIVSVLVVEDDDDTRLALAESLDGDLIRCVASARSVEEALAVQEPFDVALVDLTLGRESGLSLIGRLNARGVRVLVLTVLGDPAMLESALRLGADGYLLKDVEPAMLRRAVREVHRGEHPVSARMTQHLIGRFRGQERRSPLSPRELEVLHVFATGASYAECAAQLGLAVGTIQNHVKHIYDKLGVSSKTEAVAMATRLGILGS